MWDSFIFGRERLTDMIMALDISRREISTEGLLILPWFIPQRLKRLLSGIQQNKWKVCIISSSHFHAYSLVGRYGQSWVAFTTASIPNPSSNPTPVNTWSSPTLSSLKLTIYSAVPLSPPQSPPPKVAARRRMCIWTFRSHLDSRITQSSAQLSSGRHNKNSQLGQLRLPRRGSLSLYRRYKKRGP